MSVIQESITSKLAAALNPLHLEVLNESHMHSVPANSETHFKLVIVAEAFNAKRKVARQQSVYQLLPSSRACHAYLHPRRMAKQSSPRTGVAKLLRR